MLLLSNFFSHSCCSSVLSVLLSVLTTLSLLQVKYLHLYNVFRNTFNLLFVPYSLPFLSYIFQHCKMLNLTNVFLKVNGRSTFLLEQLIHSQLADNFPFFEPTFSFLYPKRPVIGPYTHEDELKQVSSILF
jgi:phosphoglycerol transferase MdoB-like AlkP superfamily enzyme